MIVFSHSGSIRVNKSLGLAFVFVTSAPELLPMIMLPAFLDASIATASSSSRVSSGGIDDSEHDTSAAGGDDDDIGSTDDVRLSNDVLVKPMIALGAVGMKPKAPDNDNAWVMNIGSVMRMSKDRAASQVVVPFLLAKKFSSPQRSSQPWFAFARFRK